MKAVCQLLPFLFFLSLTVLLHQVSGLSSFLSEEYNLLKAAFQLLRFLFLVSLALSSSFIRTFFLSFLWLYFIFLTILKPIFFLMITKRKKALAMNTLALNNLCNWHLSGVLGGEGSSPNSKQQAEKSGETGRWGKKKKKKLPFPTPLFFLHFWAAGA